MNKIDELKDIAQRNGMTWEVENQATRLMEQGVTEMDAYLFACIEWDLI